jgi:LPS sulfotransferase NodH
MAWWPDEPPAQPTQARTSCFVSGTPRGGTWLLAGLLAGTGLVGRPHEYFWRDTEADYRRRWRVPTFGAYVDAVKAAATGTNGVLGAKLMWAQLPDLVARLREGDGSPTDREVLERAFPGPRFVRIVRHDVVAQADSFDKAIRTAHWHDWDPPAQDVPLEFDFDRVDHPSASCASTRPRGRRGSTGTTSTR